MTKAPKDRILLIVIIALLAGAILGVFLLNAVEPIDRGACLESRMRPAYSYYTPKPAMWHHVPARKVCKRWEFPEGKSE